MKKFLLKNHFPLYKELVLSGRYITPDCINPLLTKYEGKLNVEAIGSSVLGKTIHCIKLGFGPIKVLMWSQMHGNESTTTKSLFDMIGFLFESKSDLADYLLSNLTLMVIPILNPDGALNYTRINANGIDLNRDAMDLSQPESKILSNCFEQFNPDYCFNLHGQRTIFSAGKNALPATVSFLTPAQDMERSITPSRLASMKIIVAMNEHLQQLIPHQVGRYDDTFNSNCVGDAFQSLNTPTILFEAGHFLGDYDRDIVRDYILQSLLVGLIAIIDKEDRSDVLERYLEIPENDKLFYDVIIRNAKLSKTDVSFDIGIMFQETLIDNKIEFVPKIIKICDLGGFYGHKEINADHNFVYYTNDNELKEGDSIDFVIINNIKHKINIKLK